MLEEQQGLSNYCHHWVKKSFIILVAVCLSFFLIVEARNSLKKYDYIGKSAEVPNSISISGEGKASAAPDIAKIQIGLSTDAKTVIDAQKENTAKMNAVIAAIKDKGVADKDVKTSDYNIYPKYDWQNGKNNVTGYTVSQNLEVKIRDTKKVSDILTAATDKGANQVGNLSFQIDDKDALKNQAREQAIKNAQTKAKVLAEQLNVKLGKVISFSEFSENDGVYPSYGIGGGVVAEKAVVPTVETGENEIKVNVTIVYEIL